MTKANSLTFDVVIATRNRPDALALTIPLLLSQSRLPEKLIVIDSSDDHAPVAKVVAETTAGHPVEIIVEHSEKGLTRQRNRGLAHVTADIVFLPDDDSLCHPGTTAAIMDIYERDTDRLVAGVNPADAPEPPPGVLDGAAYQMSEAHRRMARTVRLRTRLGRAMTDLKPHFVIGNILVGRAPDLPWLDQMNAVKVEWLTGYRMSFRSDVIKAVGFEEVFGGHALFEDIDASFAAARFGQLIGARNGRIYHHRFPSGRGNRYMLSAMAVVNLTYLIAKHGADLNLTPAERRQARAKTVSHYRLRLLKALAQSLRDPGARDDLRGLRAARPEMDRLFAVPRDSLAQTYLDAKRRLNID